VRLRAMLFQNLVPFYSRILDLNDTQGGVVSIIFKYCDDNKMLLLDLDLKVINFITEEGKDEIIRIRKNITPLQELFFAK
jgi:hypothetical protein